jgi:hypothetical protein
MKQYNPFDKNNISFPEIKTYGPSEEDTFCLQKQKLYGIIDQEPFGFPKPLELNPIKKPWELDDPLFPFERKPWEKNFELKTLEPYGLPNSYDTFNPLNPLEKDSWERKPWERGLPELDPFKK